MFDQRWEVRDVFPSFIRSFRVFIEKNHNEETMSLMIRNFVDVIKTPLTSNSVYHSKIFRFGLSSLRCPGAATPLPQVSIARERASPGW